MQQRRRIFPILTALIFASLFALVVFLANRGWQAGNGVRSDIGTEYETAFVVDILEDKTVSDPAIEGRLRGSKLLELEMPTAGMRTNRIGYDGERNPIEYSTHIIPGKKCTLVFDHKK
jgi:hypothetical protein